MVKGLTGGWSNVGLTGIGREQARLAGIRLESMIGDRPFDFYASDLPRAAQTAEIIGGFLPTRPVLVQGLRELNNGAAANLTKAEAEKIVIPITQPTLDWAPYPGAESWRRMSERVMAFMESIKDGENDLALLIVHAGSGNAVVHWWLGLGHGGQNTSFTFDPCSISRLTANEWGERVIEKLNDTAHLYCTEDE